MAPPSNKATQQQAQQQQAEHSSGAPEYKSLDDFYPFYTGEHSKTGTRLLHVVGTGLMIAQVAAALVTRKPQLLATGLATAYGCAWLGHFAIEGNRPATFKYPWLSAQGDWRMFINILTGKEQLRGRGGAKATTA